MLVALKTGRLPIAQDAPPEGLPSCWQPPRIKMTQIAANANAALRGLQRADTRDALCLRFIHEDDDLARQIAIESGYARLTRSCAPCSTSSANSGRPMMPSISTNRLMRAIYEASSSELRQRIAARVQRAGKTPYLTILAGVDYRSRAEVNPAEASLLIRILAENHEWERLWRLAPELALPFSQQIIHLLEPPAGSP
jgi:hypothetical protein